MPTRLWVFTLSTVSNASHVAMPLIVIFPLACVKDRVAPVRRSVTPVTWYPLSPTVTELPDVYPPPLVLPIDSQIWRKYPSAKVLKLTWLDGKSPLTFAVSAISDLMDEPALATYRPTESFGSTVESEPSYHHAPLEGSL